MSVPSLPEVQAMRDILDTLKSEHDTLRELFKRINATADSGVDLRGELLQKSEAALIPHAKWEEMDEEYAEWKDSSAAADISLHAKVKTAAASILRSPSSPG